MPRDNLLIIGYGNSLRGDDAAGYVAAQRLAECGFEAVAVHQLLPELAEKIAQYRTVIFLDAHTGLPPGEISVEPLANEPNQSVLDHHCSPAGLIRLARAAYGAEPTALLIGIGAAQFDLGDSLSAPAEAGVRRAIAEVTQRAS